LGAPSGDGLPEEEVTMIQFDLIRPGSVKEACDFLDRNLEVSKVKGAGISLIILLKQGLFRPKYLVNLDGLEELRFIREGGDGSLRLGALTTHRDIETSDLIGKRFYVLKEMELELGSVQLRNRGTIGGSLCHAEPLSDPPSVMIALGGEAKCMSSQGERSIPLEDFFQDYYETALKENEILTEIVIPEIPDRTGCAYVKHTLRKAMDKPYVGVAVYLQLDKKEPVCKDVRVVLGALSVAPFRAREVEGVLLNQRVDESLLEKASEQDFFDGVDIIYDIRCPEEYKKDVTPAIIKRALRLAFSRAAER
jgi:CO/xanthine dehydrogenase FAD-binding subunit